MPARTTDQTEVVEGANQSVWDDFAVDAETLSTDFGIKFKMGIKPGESSLFIGTFQGWRDVPDPDNDGEIMQAAEFTHDDHKYYCWLFYALSDLKQKDMLAPGDLVRMEYKGESPTSRGLNDVKVVEIQRKRPTKK